MDKFLKVVGLIVVVWIAVSIIGSIAGFIFHTVLWVALIAGGVYVAGAIAHRKNRQIGSRR